MLKDCPERKRRKGLIFVALLAIMGLAVAGYGGSIVGPTGDMVYVPAGNFTMGSSSGESDEQPVHTVYLSPYYIDKYEVTNSQFAGFLSAGNGSHYYSSMMITQSGSTYTSQSGYGNHPVVYVNWNGAKAYCEWAGKRLPTEAEWEKAARGTDGRTYPWGEADPSASPYRANYYLGTNGAGDGYQETAPVGSFPAGVSPYGAYDMAGNVWEWVADWYNSTYYSSSPSSNPQGPSSGTYRVMRGGSWDGTTDYLRAADRGTRLRSLFQGRRHRVSVRSRLVPPAFFGIWNLGIWYLEFRGYGAKPHSPQNLICA